MGTKATISITDGYATDRVEICHDGHAAWVEILEVCDLWKRKNSDTDPTPAPGDPAGWAEAFLDHRSRRSEPHAERTDDPGEGNEHRYEVTILEGEATRVRWWRKMLTPHGTGRRSGEPIEQGYYRLAWSVDLHDTGDWTDGAPAFRG